MSAMKLDAASWTREPPTVDGLYWFRWSIRKQPEILRVEGRTVFTPSCRIELDFYATGEWWPVAIVPPPAQRESDHA